MIRNNDGTQVGIAKLMDNNLCMEHGTWTTMCYFFALAFAYFICFEMDSSINLIFAANPVNCGDIKLTGNKAFGYVNLI